MGIISILLYVFISYLIYDFIKKNRKQSDKDPNQPWALPIIGHLHLFGDRPHRSFTTLSKKFGGVFTIWMGDVRSMVVTDVHVLRELLLKQHSLFANRPRSDSTGIYSGGFKDLSFANDERWRTNRKLVSSALTKTKVSMVLDLIEVQAKFLIESMNFYSKSGQPFFPHKYYSKYTMNIVMKMGFNKTIAQDESIDQGAIAKLTVAFYLIMEKLGSGDPSDFLSFTKPFFYFETEKYRTQVNIFIKFLEELYDEHVSTIDESNPRDLMDQLIISTNGKEKDTVIHVSADFLLAGSDTNASTIEWLCLYFSNNPECQKKAYDELISVVGKDCSFVNVKHRDSCPYLVGCIKETLRMRTPAPLSLLRIAEEDYTTSTGIYIPKGTQIFPNLYGIAQNYVDEPSSFKPERWVDYYQNKKPSTEVENGADNSSTTNNYKESKDYFNDLDKVVLPFSIGVRNCPGNIISESILFIACSNILLNFEVSSIDGKPINDYEVFGVTIHPNAFPLNLKKRN